MWDRYRVRIAAAALLLGAIVVTVVYLSVQRTLQSLAPARQPGKPINESLALGRLLLLTVAVALVAMALVEFVKRLSPIRSWFNRAAFVEAFVLPAPYVEGIEYQAKAVIGAGVQWQGRIEEVCGALSTVFHQQLLREQSPNGVARQTDIEQREKVWTDSFQSSWPAGTTVEKSLMLLSGLTVQELRELPDDMLLQVKFEERLDRYQARTTRRWIFWLRVCSAVVAGSLAYLSGVHGWFLVRVGLFFIGCVIGGPISWVARDLVRTLESHTG